MNIAKATARYESWLGRHLSLLDAELKYKHEQMAAAVFPFLRATYYRWAQTWAAFCGEAAHGPKVLAVGDLHVENFGTWRDIEGRLIWGINDLDEAWPMPFTGDLIRLATSALLSLDRDEKTVCDALLKGYQDAIEAGGGPFTLAEHHHSLRAMATARLHEPEKFWDKLHSLPDVKEKVPAGAKKVLARMMPERGLACRVVHRVAGLGSLGRQRFAALAEWHGGSVAREAKALAPSACVWAEGGDTAPIRCQDLLDTAVRCPDPFVRLKAGWIARRLAPDCSRIELASLPAERDEGRLLHAMGWETANIHLGSLKPRALAAGLKPLPRGWLLAAARAMRNAVSADWEEWKQAQPPAPKAAEPARARPA
jgi:hypothetical protein